MNQKDFETVIKQTDLIALATSVGNHPNVRLVNICYDTNTPGVLYFVSDKTDQKVTEFEQNELVSFTTVPSGSVAHIRSINASVCKSQRTIEDLKALFSEKNPGFEERIKADYDAKALYEIHTKEALVIKGYTEAGVVSF